MIEQDEELLARLEARLSPGGGIVSTASGNPNMHNKMEEIVPRIADLRTQITNEKIEYVEELNALKQFIRTIDDYQLRLIISYHFIDLLTWDQTAAKIGGGNTAAGVKKRCFRFLRETRKK